jgi:hypothetical protein
MKMEEKECSETSAYKIQTPGNYPEEKTYNILFSRYSVSNYPTNFIKLPVICLLSNLTSNPATQIYSIVLKFGVLFEPIMT